MSKFQIVKLIDGFSIPLLIGIENCIYSNSSFLFSIFDSIQCKKYSVLKKDFKYMTLENRRKELLKVEEELLNINDSFLIVTEEASVTRNNNDPFIRKLRDTLINHEKNTGGDPDEDWLKGY